MRGPPTTFWGKLSSETGDWHPLLDHCADVAACCEALLSATILNRRLAHLAGLEALDDVQVARLSVLAALHDVGKFNSGFQRRAVGGAPIGHTSQVAREVRARYGPRRRTLERWARWWREHFPTMRLWRAGRAQFATPVDEETLPRSLVARFAGDDRERVAAMLLFLSPLTTTSAPDI